MSRLSIPFFGVLTSHNETSETEQHPGAEVHSGLCQLCQSWRIERLAFIGNFLRMCNHRSWILPGRFVPALTHPLEWVNRSAQGRR